ncbi:hypothetical protein T484DRAFT_1858188 [Baffinella frigidus]|nr:hypothetical protein T484DRAFT_1858188 [Cryptophyta sp. CCMP2293]
MGDGGDVEAPLHPSTRPTAIVVGAGFGGLSVAGRLARAGYSVTCLEKAATPGGRCAELVRDGHRRSNKLHTVSRDTDLTDLTGAACHQQLGLTPFDMGPSIILVPAAYREAFEALGDSLTSRLELLRVDPTYKVRLHDGTALELTSDVQRMEKQLGDFGGGDSSVRFHDGTALELTSDLQRMEKQLEEFEPGSFKKFLKMVLQGHDNLHDTLQNIAHRNFYSLFEFFNPLNGDNLHDTLQNIAHRNFYPLFKFFNPLDGWLLYKLNVLVKHFSYVSKLFADPRLRAAFSFQDMYINGATA